MAILEEELIAALSAMSNDKAVSIIVSAITKKRKLNTFDEKSLRDNLSVVINTKEQSLVVDCLKIAESDNSKIILKFAKSIEALDIDIINSLHYSAVGIGQNYEYVIKNLTSLNSEKRSIAMECITGIEDVLKNTKDISFKLNELRSIIFKTKKRKEMKGKWAGSQNQNAAYKKPGDVRAENNIKSQVDATPNPKKKKRKNKKNNVPNPTIAESEKTITQNEPIVIAKEQDELTQASKEVQVQVQPADAASVEALPKKTTKRAATAKSKPKAESENEVAI